MTSNLIYARVNSTACLPRVMRVIGMCGKLRRNRSHFQTFDERSERSKEIRAAIRLTHFSAILLVTRKLSTPHMSMSTPPLSTASSDDHSHPNLNDFETFSTEDTLFDPSDDWDNNAPPQGPHWQGRYTDVLDFDDFPGKSSWFSQQILLTPSIYRSFPRHHSKPCRRPFFCFIIRGYIYPLPDTNQRIPPSLAGRRLAPSSRRGRSRDQRSNRQTPDAATAERLNARYVFIM